MKPSKKAKKKEIKRWGVGVHSLGYRPGGAPTDEIRWISDAVNAYFDGF
jgi:hypothetical protein